MNQTKKQRVTEELVWGVCDDLLKAGVRPAIERIRERVGGSPNTVAMHLESWFKGLAARLHAVEAGEAPPTPVDGIPQEVVGLANQVWKSARAAATAAAEASVAVQRREAAEAVARAEEEKRRVEAALVERGERVLALEAEVRTGAEARRSLETKAQQAANELGNAKGRLEEMGNAIEGAQSDLREARLALVRERAEGATALKEERARHEDERKSWMLEVDRARGEEGKALKREELAMEKVGKLQGDLRIKGEEMARLEVRLQLAVADGERSRKETAEARQMMAQELEAAKNREQSLDERLGEALRSAASMSDEVREAHESIERLRKEVETRLRGEQQDAG